MDNKNSPAFPTEVSITEHGIAGPQIGSNTWMDLGLSKREYIAANVLPECIGLFSPENPNEAAKLAVEYADALLAELEK